MIGDKSKFAKLKLKDEGFVTYGDNNKGKILENGVTSKLGKESITFNCLICIMHQITYNVFLQNMMIHGYIHMHHLNRLNRK